MTSNEISAVGVIGLGLMGTPIARHLVAAGYAVSGYDIDPTRMATAARLGVVPARSVKEVAASSSVILTVLPSVEALNAVCGDLGSRTSTRYLVEVSTLTVDAKLVAADRVAEAGIALLDCPVIGTSAQAESGEIVMCTSGPEPAVQAVDPVLQAFTQRREYLGKLGAGSNMKLVANLLVAVHNAASAEALTLARQLGIDPTTALRVLVGTSAGSRQLELRGPMMAAERYEPVTATVSTFIKDIGLISDLARSAGSPVPLLDSASDLYTAALALENGDLDCSSVHAVFADLADGTTVGRKS